MTIFEFIKIVLDDLYEQGNTYHGSGLDEIIKAQTTHLSAEYKKLTSGKRDPISYKDPATRFAYVFTYVTAHSDYVSQIMGQLSLKLKGQVFQSSSANVSCLGGGPGSDIVGILKYLDSSHIETVEKLRFYLLDKEQGWADTWTEIDENFNTKVSVNTNFQPLDVTKPDSYAAQTKFFNADLFTFIYFVSEVFSLDEDDCVSNFWLDLFSRAKPGALFLYIDNGSPKFNDFIDDLIAEADLEILREDTNKSMTPSYNEQKDALQFYIEKFGAFPKLKSLLSVRLMRKK